MKTVAHYKNRPSSILLALIIGALIIFGFVRGALDLHSVIVGNAEVGMGYLAPIDVVVIVLGLISIAMVALVIWRNIVDHGRALWIENGRIILLHRFNFCVPCRDIVNISTGTFGRQNKACIKLQLTDGTAKSIPTYKLAESPSAIIADLEACRSPRLASQS